MNLNKFCNNYMDKKIFIPVNASICLLKPSINDFKKMMEMIKRKVDKYGYYKSISNISGPDENILLEYYLCQKRSKVHILGPEFLVTPWRYKINHPLYNKIKKPIIYNYDSTEKPWLKEKKDLFPEEEIWYEIKTKIFN